MEAWNSRWLMVPRNEASNGKENNCLNQYVNQYVNQLECSQADDRLEEWRGEIGESRSGSAPRNPRGGKPRPSTYRYKPPAPIQYLPSAVPWFRVAVAAVKS